MGDDGGSITTEKRDLIGNKPKAATIRKGSLPNEQAEDLIKPKLPPNPGRFQFNNMLSIFERCWPCTKKRKKKKKNVWGREVNPYRNGGSPPSEEIVNGKENEILPFATGGTELSRALPGTLRRKDNSLKSDRV